MLSFKAVGKAFAYSLLVGVIAWLVSILNIFGLESTSDRAADAIYQRVAAPYYGDHGADSANNHLGQKTVRVVYLDERSIKNLEGVAWRYPPTVGNQAEMVDDLLTRASAPPAAIFIDFIYLGEVSEADKQALEDPLKRAMRTEMLRPHPGCFLNPLFKIACIVAAGGTPVIAGRPEAEKNGFFTPTQRWLDSMTVMTPVTATLRAYPLVVSHGALDPYERGRLGVHDFDISPAAAMYVAWCLKHISDASGCGSAFDGLWHVGLSLTRGETIDLPRSQRVLGAMFRALGGGPDQQRPRTLDVVWGAKPAPEAVDLIGRIAENPADCGAKAGIWSSLKAAVRSLHGDQAAPPSPPACLYTTNVSYDSLSSQSLTRQDLDGLISGKLVMIGGQFHASNDWVESPVYGQVAGVYYHAMALDNLIDGRGRYRSSAPVFMNSDLLKAILVSLLTFAGCLLLMHRNCLSDRAEAKRGHRRLHFHEYASCYLLLVGGVVSLALGVTILGVQMQQLTPINWIGILFAVMAGLGAWIMKTLPDDVAGTLEKWGPTQRLLTMVNGLKHLFDVEKESLFHPRHEPRRRAKSKTRSHAGA